MRQYRSQLILAGSSDETQSSDGAGGHFRTERQIQLQNHLLTFTPGYTHKYIRFINFISFKALNLLLYTML